MAGKNRRSPAARALEQKQFRGRAIPDKRRDKLTREDVLEALQALGDAPFPEPEDLVPGYEQRIIAAAWLYYHSDLESPISDAVYDQMVQYVVLNWHATTPGFRKRLTREDLCSSTSLFNLKTTKAEQRFALAWARGELT